MSSCTTTTYDQMRRAIEDTDFQSHVVRAQKSFGLHSTDVHQALCEYRHFMFLVWQNNLLSNETPVVPTQRADAIWHAHLLSNREYNAFCEAVHGKIIYHNADDYQEGTDALAMASSHTRMLHIEHGEQGFVEVYLSTYHKGRRAKDDVSTTGVAMGGEPPAKADADSGSDGSAAMSTSAGDGGAASCAGAAGCGGGG